MMVTSDMGNRDRHESRRIPHVIGSFAICEKQKVTTLGNSMEGLAMYKYEFVRTWPPNPHG